MYHDSLLPGHQGPYRTAMMIRQKLVIHNLSEKVHQNMSYLFKDKT